MDRKHGLSHVPPQRSSLLFSALNFGKKNGCFASRRPVHWLFHLVMAVTLPTGHFSVWWSLRVYVYRGKHRRPCLSGCIYATISLRMICFEFSFISLEDEVDAKIVVAGISTTCSQKIQNRLELAAVGLEQGGIHQGSGNGVAGSSGTLSGNKNSGVFLACEGKAAGEAETDASFRNQAWQEEVGVQVDRAHQGQRDAEGKLSSLEADVQKNES